MRRRSAATFAALAVLLLAGCGTPEASSENLLLITVDTLRADHLAIDGGPVATPHLDALARSGVALEHAYTPTPTTAPAHASLFTGLHPWRHGVLSNAVSLHPEMPTLATQIQEAGITTAAFVASWILSERFGFARGFDGYEVVANLTAIRNGRRQTGFYGHGEDVAAKASEWIRTRVGGGRFFLWIHFFDPHAPYRPPAAFALAPDEPVDLAGKQLPPDVASRSELASAIRAYRGEVRRTDAQIGKLIAALDETGLRASTAVIVTSDHGEGLGDHGLMAHGKNLFEELVRVPWIVNGPGIPARGRIEGLAQLEDLLPTILSLLGVAPLEGVDGLDLTPWLRGDVAASPRQAVLGQRKIYPGEPNLHYRHTGREKWIGQLDGPGEAFTLERDPHERGGSRASAPEALRQAVTGPTRDTARDLDEESRRALEALGYLEPSDDSP